MSFFDRPATSILHPTDFSETSEAAFAHALAIALQNQAELRILHVVRDATEEIPWEDYPSVRKTLERWGKLEPGSRQGEVAKKLGIKVRKMFGVDKNVPHSISELCNVEMIDLIVMATDENRTNPFWPVSGTALTTSKQTQLPTLFVPNGVRGSVSVEDGSTNLNQILIAVDHKPDAQPAIERIVWALDKFGGNAAQVTLLHVGDEDRFPLLDPPTHGKFSWSTMSRSGNAAKQIVNVAEEIMADVIVMVTESSHGFWDVLKGSTTQQVLKHAPCLVFAIPEGGF